MTGRRLIRGPALFILVGLSLTTAGCRGSSDHSLQPADLYGTWEGKTQDGLAFFIFEAGEMVNHFELRAGPGEFTAVLDSGEVILSKGRWGITGTTLNLFDEGAIYYYYTCLGSVADPYDVIMNPAGDEMQLDYLGDNCAPRGHLLHSATWVRPEDNLENNPG